MGRVVEVVSGKGFEGNGRLRAYHRACCFHVGGLVVIGALGFLGGLAGGNVA